MIAGCNGRLATASVGLLAWLAACSPLEYGGSREQADASRASGIRKLADGGAASARGRA